MRDRIGAERRLAEKIAVDDRTRLAERRAAVLEPDAREILTEELVAISGQTLVTSRAGRAAVETQHHMIAGRDRKSVVEGKRVSVRVDLGGRRIIKKKKNKNKETKDQYNKLTLIVNNKHK